MLTGVKRKKKEHAKEADRLYHEEEEEETLWFCIEMRAAYRRNFSFSFLSFGYLSSLVISSAALYSPGRSIKDDASHFFIGETFGQRIDWLWRHSPVE